MDDLIRLDSISDYNDMAGTETRHPLVSVINLSSIKPFIHRRQSINFYAIFLKDTKCGDIRYGRNIYDYREGTLMFAAPGQVLDYENNGEPMQPIGWALLFHPDLLRGTHLAQRMKILSFDNEIAQEASIVICVKRQYFKQLQL